MPPQIQLRPVFVPEGDDQVRQGPFRGGRAVFPIGEDGRSAAVLPLRQGGSLLKVPVLLLWQAGDLLFHPQAEGIPPAVEVGDGVIPALGAGGILPGGEPVFQGDALLPHRPAAREEVEKLPDSGVDGVKMGGHHHQGQAGSQGQQPDNFLLPALDGESKGFFGETGHRLL